MWWRSWLVTAGPQLVRQQRLGVLCGLVGTTCRAICASRGVRADSGFCLPELLAFVEEVAPAAYVVVAQLSQPIQKLLRSDLQWAATEVAGTEVAERSGVSGDELATPASAGIDPPSGAG